MHDPRRATAHRRGHPRRDRHRHEPLPVRRAPRLAGPANARQRPLRRQTPLRQNPRRLQMADTALKEAAMAATRTKDVYLAAQYQRLRPRRGHEQALGAVKHSIICACWHMLSAGELYNELGGDYFQRRDPERITKPPRRPTRSTRTPSHPGGRSLRSFSCQVTPGDGVDAAAKTRTCRMAGLPGRGQR